MPWRIEKNEELGFMEIVYTGTITNKDVRDATAKVLSLTNPDRPNLYLADISGARFKLSFMDILNITSQWEEAGRNKRGRVAVIVSEETMKPEDLRFLETAARNRGWNLRVFEDRQAAIEWLPRN